MARDPYRYFRIEARELLEQLGKAALELEGGAAAEATARMLRLAHTLKGAARVVRQAAIAERSHALEGALAPLRDQARAAPREKVDEVLALIDGMGQDLAQLPTGEAEASPAPAP